MPGVHRRHSLISAPIDEVWDVVADPMKHADWWPEIERVRMSEQPAQGSHYTQVARRMGFLDLVDATWTVERLEHLKEAHFRCTVTGTYTRFSLTPAQDDTFVQIEAGVDPTGVQGRLMRVTEPLWMNRWLRELLDALPEAVTKSSSDAQT
jgi:Polyketide cyclase / dehydrase and lipid transport